jgi:fibronectin type 3 domain-containing protein
VRAQSQSTPATLTPSSGTLSTSQTFTWSNGVGPTEYQLQLGTAGAGSTNLYSSGAITATSATVSIPAAGVTVYATFWQLINNAWTKTNYTFTEPTPYEVILTWDAPTDSTDPVAGYNVYRAISGSSTYELLNSSLDATTTYTDATVQNATAYVYYVESVDAEGSDSVPSNTYTVSIP